jgi:hypothetical protein
MPDTSADWPSAPDNTHMPGLGGRIVNKTSP